MIDTATAACSVALIEDGAVIAHIYETVGRGHAERLLPMIAELPDGGRADHILVDCGPGSFTGVRVGVAAARGLSLGWSAQVTGYSSLAAIAAAHFEHNADDHALAVVIEGGHGEVFLQGFTTSPLTPDGALASRTPTDALAALAGRRAIGSGVHRLAALDPTLAPSDALPDAASALLLPADLATLPPVPLYGRAPDAVPQAIRINAVR